MLPGIQVKYLKQEKTVENKLKTIVVDRTIGMIGIVHDLAPKLSDHAGGLVSKITNEENSNPNLFNLNDPCHIFSLSIRKSLGELPQNLTKFIVKLHAHFSSSQRKKLLIRIQEQQNGISSPLVLKKYDETS